MKVFALSAVRAFGAAGLFFLAVCSAVLSADGTITVVATLFPQYDFARTIAGDHAEVTLLLPPGSEAHSFEPTPSAMKKIAAADVFIYTGDYMEPWAKRLVDAAGKDGWMEIVDASHGIAMVRDDDNQDHDHHHEPEEAHSHDFDPHIWLDPVLAVSMINTIARGLATADPAHAPDYLGRGAELADELTKLHEEFQALVAAAPRRELVFGERFAFAYFFRRYGLEAIGAYKSCAPGAEPGLKAVIEVVEYVKNNGVKFIYRETMSTSRISTVIRQETGAEILAVDSLHNPPAKAQQAGATYIGIMKENMAAFARGLE